MAKQYIVRLADKIEEDMRWNKEMMEDCQGLEEELKRFEGKLESNRKERMTFAWQLDEEVMETVEVREGEEKAAPKHTSRGFAQWGSR